jgi:protein-disulfide isomerase
VGFTAAAYVALLVPGMQTPRSSSSSPESVAQAAPLPGSLEAYLKGLSAQEQQAVADALAVYRRATPLPAPSPARRLYGSPSAPVKMVEWTDSRCPHCKALVETLAVMKKRLPEGKLALEARQYPLDSECNFTIPPQYTDGSGTRCVAAKAQICLEDAPDYWELREKLFAAQRSLTSRDVVLQVLSSGSVSRMQLDGCIARQDTERKLRDDIAYAKQHEIRGTPLVVINGREAPAFPAFIYALVLADGNPDASAFGTLPAPRDLQARQGH